MVALLIALALHGSPVPRWPIISVAQPVKTPVAHNARQRKLIAEGCIKVALHEWICPMAAPTRRHK